MSLHRFLLVVICGVFIASRAVSGKDETKAVGDQVSFKLDKIVPPVTSITWKHIKPGALTVKAIEWEDREITIPNSRFKGITDLNTETGQITITKLTVEHSGVYTIDVSGKEQAERFTLTVMDRVPKPVIEVEKIPDNPDVAYLSCKYSGTITWSNSAGETLAYQSSRESITVEKNKGDPENSYTCTLKNAVSAETSDPINKKDLFNDESTGGHCWIAIIVILFLVIGICFALYKHNQKFKTIQGNFQNEESGVETNRPASQDPLETDRCLMENLQNEVSGVETNRPASQDPLETDRGFKSFVDAKTCEKTLESFSKLCQQLEVEPREYQHFYSNLKLKLKTRNAKDLWQKIDKRAKKQEDRVNCQCLVLGAGPCGLRTAIELALHGTRVVVLDKRTSFTRNNLLHLKSYTTEDLKDLGIKTFYTSFGIASYHHISIRQLQLFLLKLALILGVEVHTGVTFEGLREPSRTSSNGPDMKLEGWRANVSTESVDYNKRLEDFQFDVFISAAGTGYKLTDFEKIRVWEELAIGITANFVNHKTKEDRDVPETGSITYVQYCTFFGMLQKQKKIHLKNIVYLKGDETHYFVMTAEKQNLINEKVINKDLTDVKNLLKPENINQDALQKYALEAARFYTQNNLSKMEFAKNNKGAPDVSIFDFTCLHKADKASLVKEKEGKKLLIGLVGDSLMEPYWPLGTGIAIGFLSVFDAVCMVRDWARGAQNVTTERERVYGLLCELKENYSSKNSYAYVRDLSKRYSKVILPEQVPKPEIKIENSTNNPDVVYLICEYDVKIIWKNSAGETLTDSEQRLKGESLTVTKTGNPEIFYTCTLQNADSEETSDPVYERDLFKGCSAVGGKRLPENDMHV